MRYGRNLLFCGSLGIIIGGTTLGYVGGNYLLNQSLNLMGRQISELKSPENLIAFIPTVLTGVGAVLSVYIAGTLENRLFRNYR